MSKVKVPRIVSPAVKLLQKDDEKVTFQVIGVPYYGPKYLDGKDFHGEFFSKTTDYARDDDGTPMIKTVYAYYDHALNDNVGKSPIGFAKFVEETDAGQIWNIEILRAYRYRDMLDALEVMASKGLLGASSQPIQTSVEVDWDSGHIKSWHVAEISLTPTPANPAAVAEVLKRFNIEVNEMGKQKTEGDNALENPSDVENPTENVTTGESDNDIDKLFEGLDNDPNIEANKSINALFDMVKALDAKVDGLVSSVSQHDDKIKTAVDVIARTNANVQALGVNIVKRLKTELSEEDRRGISNPQREAEEEVLDNRTKSNRNNVTSLFPDDAPGVAVRGKK